jgi:hypothetical protein
VRRGWWSQAAEEGGGGSALGVNKTRTCHTIPGTRPRCWCSAIPQRGQRRTTSCVVADGGDQAGACLRRGTGAEAGGLEARDLRQGLRWCVSTLFALTQLQTESEAAQIKVGRLKK